MNNLTHWQDDMDEALVGDFDGSLSGLCIMSLSFDFTPNGPGPHINSSRDTTTANNHQNTNGLFDTVNPARSKSINYGLNINHDIHNDNSNNCFNYFKRFKPAIANESNNFDEENRSNSQNKIVRQLQQIKNCLNTTSITNTTTTITANNLNNSTTINNSANNNSNNNNHNNNNNSSSKNTCTTVAAISSQAQVVGVSNEQHHNANRTSPRSSETPCRRASTTSTPDESSRTSTTGPRSPSPNSSKQKFQYVLGEPISVATKLTEDTMTYLNQGQAYEIKLENITEVAEAKKGFMCSIINIGFYERHMQQAENELWQQWSQQHPNDKIFSVDMKLSYNVFGVEWDGMNKYEFLWDSSKAAGVFIRVNSISTEFTPKKHGGEKGVPFKLSIETFSYNSKTHDSYFISAACCQVKVFKPKGAERKIRSDRDKISKRPPNEQEKYHKSCDHTIFKECSLSSLHPMADDSLCYYRHSHGHFASKQVVSNATINITTSGHVPQPTTHHQSDDEVEHADNNHNNNNNNPATSQHNQTTENRSNIVNSDNDNDHANNTNQRDYSNRSLPIASKTHQTDYSTNRLIHQSSHNYGKSSHNFDNNNENQNDHSYGNVHNTNDPSSTHPTELLPFQQQNAFNQMYHTNQVRGVASLASSQHFNMAYYSHTLPTSIPAHISTPSSYGVPTSNTLSTIGSQANHNFHMTPQQHAGVKGASSIYRSLNQEKSTTPHGTSFKASNLAITSHNNFPSYLNNHNDNPCDNHEKETNDSGSINNGNYNQNDNYDFHAHHISNSHSQQQPFRQRSASLTNGHCSSYMIHMNQARHLDNYVGNNNAILDNSNINSNSNNNSNNNNNNNNHHWSINNQTNSQVTTPNSICTQRASSDEINQQTDANNYNSYDCNNDNYDSDQNSPQKNHQHTSDSSSSCYSRSKNNSSIIPCHVQEHQFDVSKIQNNLQININSTCSEVVSWLNANRFGLFVKTFNNFSGFDLLRLSKSELIEICGLLDGIRFYNSIHNQPIKPKKILYICHKNNDIYYPIYLHEVTLKELLKELAFVYNTHIVNNDSRHNDDRHNYKNYGEKSTINSSVSNNDSRSSLGALSSEAGGDEIFGNHNDHYYNDIEVRQTKHCRTNDLTKTNNHLSLSQTVTIDRLLIEGLASVRVVATEQSVRLLEDESVWMLNINSRNAANHVEACIIAFKSKKNVHINNDTQHNKDSMCRFNQ